MARGRRARSIPWSAARAVVSALQSVVARNVAAAGHGGAQHHALRRRRRLQRDPRARSPSAARCAPSRWRRCALVEERMRALAQSIAAGFGATAELDFREITVPVVNTRGRGAADRATPPPSLVGEAHVERDWPAGDGLRGFLLHAGRSGRAPTSWSATAPARPAAARCTTRATTSTTRPSPMAAACWPRRWRGSCRGSARA